MLLTSLHIFWITWPFDKYGHRGVYSCKKKIILESSHLSLYTLSNDSIRTTIDEVKLPKLLVLQVNE